MYVLGSLLSRSAFLTFLFLGIPRLCQLASYLLHQETLRLISYETRSLSSGLCAGCLCYQCTGNWLLVKWGNVLLILLQHPWFQHHNRENVCTLKTLAIDKWNRSG